MKILKMREFLILKRVQHLFCLLEKKYGITAKNIFLCFLVFFLSSTGTFIQATDTDADTFIFKGSAAKLSGKGISKEKYGFVHSWNGLKSGTEWKFTLPDDGRYTVWLYVAVASGEGGKAEIVIDQSAPLIAEPPETGDWFKFKWFKAGEIDIQPGDHLLKISALSFKKTHLMNLRYAVLCRTGDEMGLDAWIAEHANRAERAIKGIRSFAEAVGITQTLLSETDDPDDRKILFEFLRNHYPHQMVWLEQDTNENIEKYLSAPTSRGGLDALFQTALKTVPNSIQWQTEIQKLHTENIMPEDPRWITLYEKMGRVRRTARLDRIRQYGDEIIFAKHHVFGTTSQIYLITETEGSPQPSMLCTVDLKKESASAFAPTERLFDPGAGMVRDPELSFDAKRLLFAMRPTKEHFDSAHTDLACGIPKMNYQIYEMNLTDQSIRPLTDTETYGSSFEPCYLPNGDIMFSSARMVQHITCGWGDCSNMFIMNKDGKYARRIGFDQANTAFPVLLDDGRVIYTRRDYNDRAAAAAHALFQMNPDGTGQTAFYGNQTGTPNTFHHARGIPNSPKVITIIGGYHTTQGAKLAIMDVRKGVEKAQGILQVPGYTIPEATDGYDDYYGKKGIQYSNPRALNEHDYIVSIAPNQHSHYGLYYLNDVGERELLAADSRTSCLQAVLNAPRKVPPMRPSLTDYTKDQGVFYVQNVYYGPGAEGIKPGSVKKLRVIEMFYKPAILGMTMSFGPGSGWHSVTPIGHPLAGFDAKRIIGDADVYEDGSAMFRAPSRKALFFQLLDDKNQVVQTMRSWTTLMPGENFSCVGCHEDKGSTPLNMSKKTVAFTRGEQDLKPFYGPTRGFRYMNEIQPIFDKHCITCHSPDGKGKKLLLTVDPVGVDPLPGERTSPTAAGAKRRFARSYIELTKARPQNAHNPEDFTVRGSIWARNGKRQADEPNRYISYWTKWEYMKPYPPYRAGSIRSGMIQMLDKGHQGITLSTEEMDKLRAWIDLNIPYCGEYDDDNIWNQRDQKLFRQRMDERLRNEKIEDRNIREFIRDGQP